MEHTSDKYDKNHITGLRSVNNTVSYSKYHINIFITRQRKPRILIGLEEFVIKVWMHE